jgi:hypothetical protein
MRWAFLVLLALAAWLYTLGSARLDPDPALLGRLKPLMTSPTVPLGLEPSLGERALAVLGVDPVILAGVLQVLAVFVVYGALRRHAGVSTAVLGTAGVVTGTQSSWLVCTEPLLAAEHLLTACALFALPGRRPWAAVPLVLALAVLNPLAALLLAGAGVAAHWLGTPPADDRRTMWVLGALVLAWYMPLAGWPLAAWAVWQSRSALGLLLLTQGPPAALAALVGQSLRPADRNRLRLSRDEGLRLWIPWRMAGALVFAVTLLVTVEPGERILNQRILLAAHKRDLDVLALFPPLRAADWVRFAPASWGLQTDDLELAAFLKEQQGHSLVVTPGAKSEPYEVAAFLTGTSGHCLAGWTWLEEQPTLVPGAAAFRATLDPVTLSAARLDRLVVRGESSLDLPVERRATGWTVYRMPTEEAGGGAGPLEVTPTSPVRAGNLTWLAVQPADREVEFVVWRNDRPLGAEIPVRGAGRIPLVLPPASGDYRLEWRGGHGAPVEVRGWSGLQVDLQADLEALRVSSDLQTTAPSRSLVPVRLTLQGEIAPTGARLRLEPVNAGDREPPEQLPIDPGSGTLWLRTPEHEGAYLVQLDLEAGSGARRTVNLGTVRIWRRMPPAGLVN